MGFIEELGTLAMGTRIKNLGELLMRDMKRIYRERGVDFEPRWFTFFQLILQKREVSVTEIAGNLGQTHPAAVQVINALEKKGLISTRKEKSDNRKRLVRLSARGKKLAEELQTVWDSVHRAANEILRESDPALLEKIALLEDALRRKSVYHRVKENLEKTAITVVPFNQKYLEAFRALNESWLKEYLEITDHDRNILGDPIETIIDKGGKIFCMLRDNEVIGTYALQVINKNTCELSKFTIRADHRGKKSGSKLLEHAITEARNMSFSTMLLFTHEKLSEATALYEKAGFEKIEHHPGMEDPTGRCSRLMKLSINTK